MCLPPHPLDAAVQKHDAPSHLQGARYSIPYFVNPKLNYSIQGPNKRWGPVTGFDLLSKTGERSWAGGAGS